MGKPYGEKTHSQTVIAVGVSWEEKALIKNKAFSEGKSMSKYLLDMFYEYEGIEPLYKKPVTDPRQQKLFKNSHEKET